MLAAGGLTARWWGASVRGATSFERIAAACGLVAFALAASVSSVDATLEAAGWPTVLAMSTDGRPDIENDLRRGFPDGSLAARRETLAGGYLGVTHTHPSTVTIKNADRTDMTVSGFGWDGRPFKSPIYYGLRAIRWGEGGRLGALFDFTHAKAISRFEDVATFNGRHEGRALPDKAKVGEVFKHLEFSHGHNMVTLNGVARLGFLPIQPYVGAGAGISLPHTEIGFRSENGRTYEYQYAGLTGQVLAGVEMRIGRATVFLEYKLSYSPYDVPLSGVINGHYLVTDLWRQFRAWTRSEKPPGGRLTTPLLTHHAIGGVLVRVARQTDP